MSKLPTAISAIASVFHQRITCLWLLAACLSSTGALEYTVMGKGAHSRHLEACFHYPEVAEFSMDPSQVHSVHRFASIRFVDLAPKSAVSKDPVLALGISSILQPLGHNLGW
jgi:hypothetical protein